MRHLNTLTDQTVLHSTVPYIYLQPGMEYVSESESEHRLNASYSNAAQRNATQRCSAAKAQLNIADR